MAQRADHYKRAEEYLAELDKIDAAFKKREGDYVDPHTAMQVNATREYLLKRAQIHATMASAQIEGNPS